VPVDTVNPNYIKIESDIIGNKQSINGIENSMKKYNEYLDELEDEKLAIYKYYRTGETDELKNKRYRVS